MVIGLESAKNAPPKLVALLLWKRLLQMVTPRLQFITIIAPPATKYPSSGIGISLPLFEEKQLLHDVNDGHLS